MIGRRGRCKKSWDIKYCRKQNLQRAVLVINITGFLVIATTAGIAVATRPRPVMRTRLGSICR
jgi:hypothetical protein